MYPQDVLKEFGIDVHGPDPDGQYQWKMLSLKAGSPERQRLEKAWSAHVLHRKAVDLPRKPKTPIVRTAPQLLSWLKKPSVVIALAVLVMGVLWIVFQYRSEQRSNAALEAVGPEPGNVWYAKYTAIKAMLDESAHQGEHHEEFILLAEAAKSAIEAGQGAAMLAQINADLRAEQTALGPHLISELEAHKTQWKVIMEALIMNKAELLDHRRFKGHHEGEL